MNFHKHIWILAFALFAFAILGPCNAQPPSGLPFRYTLATEGNVTLGFYDSQGHLLRWLTRGAHRHAGANVEYWDGLDQYGQPISSGKYQVRGLASPPIDLEYKVSVGNSGNPPWPTADNKGDWLGDESTPQAAATDGNWVFLASPCCEKGWGIIAVNGNGQRQWGYQPSADPRAVSLAVSGNYVYAFFSGPLLTDSTKHFNGHNAQGRDILICLDKRTGLPAQFSVKDPALTVDTWPYMEQVSHLWDLRTNHTYNAGNYGGQPRYSLTDIGESTNGLGIAATSDHLYFSNYYTDTVSVLDSATAAPVDSIAVPKPVGLHALPDGTILAVSGTNILHIDPQTKVVKTVIGSGLYAPHDVTTDSTGNIYVSDWGASFQVKVFSPSGKFLRAIGILGGRPWIGKWNSNGMLVPRGITVTDSGKLWVAEDDNVPSRVSVWDSQTGAFLKDYLGPAAYGGGNWTWVNPQDPTMVMTEGTMYHVDWTNNTFQPIATALRRMSIDQAFMPNGAAGIPAEKTVVHDGKTYIYFSDTMSVVALRLDGTTLTPVAAIGYLEPARTSDGAGMSDWDSDIGYHMYPNWRPAFFAGHAGEIYAWSDLNGDGLTQDNEMQWGALPSGQGAPLSGPSGRWGTSWGAGIGPDGSIYFHTSWAHRDEIYRADIDHWTDAGVPVYTLANAKQIISTTGMDWLGGIYVTSTNKVILSYSLEPQPKPKDAIECYDRDGNSLWNIASYAGAQQIDEPADSNASGDFTIPGIGDVIGTWEWHLNQHCYLITDDGLYVAPLLDDNVVGPTQNWGESMRSYFQTPNGDPYLINGANDAYHFLKITGLNQATRFNSILELTSADITTAAAARQNAVPAQEPLPQPILRINWLDKSPVVDGDLSDWNMDTGALLKSSNNRSAIVALGRNSSNLYLAYKVNGSSLVNKGGDWRTMFLSGDCVDLMLATGPNAAKLHYSTQLGDERLLFTVSNGSPIAVLYRPVVSDTSAPQVLSTARFDRIIKLTSAKVAYQRASASYTLEASVPLADLGIDPSNPGDLSGDAGVIYADKTGANRSLRQYYYNQDTKIVDDLTTEANLQPGEWGPIEMAIGPNLLKNSGFEEPLTTDPTTGWSITEAKNGAAAAISTDCAHSGVHALALQSTPPTFAPGAEDAPDYTAFVKSANNGQGRGQVTVSQRVPIIAGAQYWLKARYLTTGMGTVPYEVRNPGPGRGYINISVSVNWLGATSPRLAYSATQPEWSNTDGWVTVLNLSSLTPLPFTAPPGATAANVNIRFIDCKANLNPKAYVDDVEFATAQP